MFTKVPLTFLIFIGRDEPVPKNTISGNFSPLETFKQDTYMKMELDQFIHPNKSLKTYFSYTLYRLPLKRSISIMTILEKQIHLLLHDLRHHRYSREGKSEVKKVLLGGN